MENEIRGDDVNSSAVARWYVWIGYAVVKVI